MPPPPPQQTNIQNEFSNWYNGVPPVTKAIMTATVLFSVGSSIGLIAPDRLVLIWPLVYRKLQLWRLVTSFCTGGLGLQFLFNLYFLYTYSTQLETDVFQGQTADYVYFWIFNGVIQLLLDLFFHNVYFISGAVVPAITYLWSKHYAEQQVSFMFGFRFKAIFLPWVLVAYEYFASGGAIPYSTLYGMASAHLYYYLKTTYPATGGRHYLTTPGFIQRAFPPTVGVRRTGAGYAYPSNQQQRQQQQQQRSSFMGGGHNWGRGHRLT